MIEYDGNVELCPFCRREAYVYKKHPLYGVACSYCSGQGPMRGKADDAVAEWNKVAACLREKADAWEKLDALEADRKDVDFLLGKAHYLIEKAAKKRDGLGAEADTWLMQYADHLATPQKE